MGWLSSVCRRHSVVIAVLAALVLWPRVARTQTYGSVFLPAVAVNLDDAAHGVGAGDVTGDGRADLVVITDPPASGTLLNVFAQDAAGKLSTPPKTYAVPGGSAIKSSLAIGDVTGDGRADVVVSLESGVGVFAQNSSGSLVGPTVLSTPADYMVRVGDLNGDGKLDVCAIPWGALSSTVVVFLQTATGSLAAPVTYAAPHEGFDDLEVGDVTGDGRDDIAVMSGQGLGPNVAVLAQTPSGTFAPAVSYSVQGPHFATTALGLGDLNADGVGDLIVGHSVLKQSLVVLKGAGTGPFASEAIYDSGFEYPKAIVVADVTGDGKQDAIVAGPGSLRPLPQLPDGTLDLTRPGGSIGGSGVGTDSLGSSVRSASLRRGARRRSRSR